MDILAIKSVVGDTDTIFGPSLDYVAPTTLLPAHQLVTRVDDPGQLAEHGGTADALN